VDGMKLLYHKVTRYTLGETS